MIDLNFDRKHLWHPYTSLVNPTPVYPVRETNGCRIILESGEQLVDGMASWWSAIHGYNNPVLCNALHTQIDRMSHVMFGGLTHGPAIELGKRLVEITPAGLDRIFFADSGSVAVEVAMKMAIQYQQNRGYPQKKRFLTVLHGYHGDTIGAMSVCDPKNGMHGLFAGVIQQQLFAPAPPMGYDRECTEEDITPIRTLMHQHQSEIAALIIEPIVQGAGGMRIYSPSYLKALRLLCDEYDVPLICDEIATGFGRTGKLFASEHADIIPDILCVGKALTGGMMTLAAVITSEKIAYEIGKEDSVFMHGPTFMGNPLACAVATANIDYLLSSSYELRVRAIEKHFSTALGALREDPAVADVRVLGAIGVVEMKNAIDIPRFQADCIQSGIWLRPFGRLAYTMPPFTISEEELHILTKGIIHAVRNIR